MRTLELGHEFYPLDFFIDELWEGEDESRSSEVRCHDIGLASKPLGCTLAVAKGAEWEAESRGQSRLNRQMRSDSVAIGETRLERLKDDLYLVG